MKTNFVLFSLMLFAFMSCKKGDTGPQGDPGPAGAPFALKEGGFIQGTISGNRSDGTPFNLSFNYKKYYGADGFYSDPFNSNYSFSLHRYLSSDPLVPGDCYLDFNLPSLSSTSPFSVHFEGDFYMDLGSNQTFHLNIYQWSSSPIIVSGFSYNSSSHVAQGSFSANLFGGDNSTGNPATVSGSFQSLAMTEYLSRIGN